MGKVLVKWKPVPQTQQPKTEVENPGVDPGCDFPLSVCVSKFIFPWFLLHWSTVRVWKYASLRWASVTSDISPSLWLLGLITSAASLNPEQKLSDTLYALFTHTDGYAEGSCTLVSGVMCSSSWHDQTRLKTGSWFAGISLFTEIVFVFYCFPVGFHRPQLPINSRVLRFKKRAWEDSSHCFSPLSAWAASSHFTSGLLRYIWCLHRIHRIQRLYVTCQGCVYITLQLLLSGQNGSAGHCITVLLTEFLFFNKDLMHLLHYWMVWKDLLSFYLVIEAVKLHWRSYTPWQACMRQIYRLYFTC